MECTACLAFPDIILADRGKIRRKSTFRGRLTQITRINPTAKPQKHNWGKIIMSIMVWVKVHLFTVFLSHWWQGTALGYLAYWEMILQDHLLHSNIHTFISIWGWWSERSLSIPELPTLRLLACDTCFNLYSHDFIVQTNAIPNNKEPLKASTYQKYVSFLVLLSDFFSTWSIDIRES